MLVKLINSNETNSLTRSIGYSLDPQVQEMRTLDITE